MVAAAIIGSAVGGGLLAANASSKAADTQAGAADRASQISDSEYQQSRTDQLAQYAQTRQDQLDQLAQTRADQAPYRDAGTSSLAQLMAGSAPGGQFTQDYQRTPFSADPGYQFRIDQGTQAINRAAQAGGSLYSGATLKALARFNSGEASQEYGAYDQRQNTAQAQFNANRDFKRNNLASMAGIGQTATTNTAQAGATATGAIGQAGQAAQAGIGAAGSQNAFLTGQDAQAAGEARASGYVGVSNAIGGGLRSIYNGYSQNQYLNSNPYSLQSLQNGTPSNATYAENDLLTS